MLLRRLEAAFAVAILIAITLLTGCYRPSIASGGFQCAPGDVCPDGFHCGPNKRCYSPDAGPACESPPPMSSCDNGPVGGACNPLCQVGCDCGWCAVSKGATTCLTVAKGTKSVGDICDPGTNADCALGLFCRPECGQTTVGRCYKICATSDDCSQDSTTCGITETSTDPSGSPSFSFRLCNLPPKQCNPVGATGGCPATNPGVFACYADSTGETYCDCMGKGTLTCSFFSDCVPGDSCVSFSGTTSGGTCEPTCASNGDCQLPTTCNFLPGDAAFGYCL